MGSEIPVDKYVIIIGAMKAGTSSLFNYLQAHPAICPSTPSKEPEFFSRKQHHGLASRGLQVDLYAQIWNFDSTRHEFALEASTGYSQFPEESGVPQRMFDYGIRPKIIYILRHPFDRILSHRNFIKNKAWAASVTFDHMISVSNYYRQLEEYRKYFPPEDMLLLSFDELKDDPMAVTRKVFQFLGLRDHDIAAPYEIHNATRLESTFEKKLRRSAVRSLFKYVPQPLRLFGNNLLSQLPAAPSPLTEAEKSKIYETLHEDMIKLHNFYGVDIQTWGFDVSSAKVK